MSSTALYKALVEAGASDESATVAVDDVIQASQLPQLATKNDILILKSDIANLETRHLKWMVASGFVFAGIVIAGVGVLMQVMLSSITVQ